MKKHRLPIAALLSASCLLFAGCADVNVQPVTAAAGTIRTVYILRNPTADETAPELEGAIEDGLQRHGISARLVDVLPLEENDYCLTYVATGGWDLAKFMKNAEIRLKRGGRQVGSASYVSGGGLSTSKFGSVHDKIDPLMDQLLSGQR